MGPGDALSSVIGFGDAVGRRRWGKQAGDLGKRERALPRSTGVDDGSCDMNSLETDDQIGLCQPCAS
jgi:hypothetical protein